ncbi:glucan endo-1,3-beta-D-glucosidase [Confluentibacter flavum]|uniref:Glucan endo-1,3-beta-D-glucosidase n=1 Tax=Confluentibacter flavum TaxID=1909700 RepID=A0A2N3HLF6_9FLAO|nr:glucan endo-1,3-beta-D-glucosidase [Confluentibacter flavum]PKQ45786.1 glucan endo-1,3-beta-D-glucosidase [Confluentibacter flavum]
MKKINNVLSILFIAVLSFTSCQEDDLTFGNIVTPSNIEVSVTYIDNDSESPAPGLGSGEIKLSATANNATAYHFVVQGQTKLQKSGSASHTFTMLGTNTYAVTVVAFGTGGASSSKTIEVDVLALYEPPADLLTMLTSNSSRTWKIASEVNKHFGLGPIGGAEFEYYGAAPGDKANSGMYDDRYTFNIDGTFTHNVGADGFVFGRDPLINELGGSGGTVNGADIEQYTFGSYTAQWVLTAPSGVETLSLTGIGFIGYYVGGNHSYQIFSRSADEMILRTTDGKGEFDWWFRLIPE